MKKILLLIFFLAILIYGWPLDSVLSRAERGLDVEWKASSQNTENWFYETYGTTCTGVNSIYKCCDFLPDSSYRSIAYSYGGEDNDSLFLMKIGKGYLVGSHLCHYNSYGDPSDTIAGTDCSGFVSWLWNVSRQSTRGFYSNNKYEKIDRDSISIGDALVKPGSHIVLVVDIDTINSKLLIVESTSAVNGVRQRLIDVYDDYWLEYYPIRLEFSDEIILNKTINKVVENGIYIKNGEIIGVPLGSIVTIYSILGREIAKYKSSGKSLLIGKNIENQLLIISIKSNEDTCLLKLAR